MEVKEIVVIWEKFCVSSKFKQVACFYIVVQQKVIMIFFLSYQMLQLLFYK